MRVTLGRLHAASIAMSVVLVAACSAGNSERDEPDASRADATDECEWPMYGYDETRSFATRCDSEISANTASRLRLDWFTRTRDVVTASPAVVDGSVYVGDWSGRFYAIDLDTGEQRWTFDAPVHPTVYSGQVVSSAAVVPRGNDGGGDGDELLVIFGSGRTLYALDAGTGDEVWSHDVNPGGGADDPSEIQSSPVVVHDTVLFGFDGHDTPGVRAGVQALDLETGDERWSFDPDAGAPPTGCAGVWGSPSVDTERGLVLFGTANCPTSPAGWGRSTEAIVAIDLETGEHEWSYQPHPPNNDDFDFAGTPNLFTVDGTDAAGLGNKDGHYYAVDRETGRRLWDVEAADVRVPEPNLSTGGFIGPTASDGDVIVGGTAVGGDCPCLHAIGTDGALRWQQRAAGPTFAPTAIVNDVAVVGSTTDFTLRAVSLADGDVLWSHTMPGAVAGGVAITDRQLVAVSGIREPGTDSASDGSGVSAFSIGDAYGSTSTTAGDASGLPPTTVAPPPADEPPAVPGDGRPCVETVCDFSFTLKEPPPGTTPQATLHVRPDPFRVEVRTEGLGVPEAWIRPGGDAARTGAVAYGVFLSVSDNNPVGSLVCVLDGTGDCVTETLPDPLHDSYNRLSILAITDSLELPLPAEGFDRIVTTQGFAPPLVIS